MAMGVRQTSGLRCTGGPHRHPPPARTPGGGISSRPRSGLSARHMCKRGVCTNKLADLLAGWLKGRGGRRPLQRVSGVSRCLGAHQGLPLAGERSGEGTPCPDEQRSAPSAWCLGERGQLPARGAATVQGPLSPRRRLREWGAEGKARGACLCPGSVA